MKAKSQWVDVKDELPKSVNDYLVTDGAACMVATFRVDKQEWDVWDIPWWSGEDITHWMELPPPPTDNE